MRTIDTIEDDFISNTLPYPKQYDGYNWNSTISTARKSLPSYLRKDLPSMKFQRVKEKFHQMNKFGPPEITYFERMIKPQRKSIKTCRKIFSSKKKQQKQLQGVREQMQYALITTNNKSRVLVNLFDKVIKIKQRLKQSSVKKSTSFQQRLIRSNKSKSLQPVDRTQLCFSNTMDIAFSLRKRQFFEQNKYNLSEDVKQSVINTINNLQLQSNIQFKTEKKR